MAEKQKTITVGGKDYLLQRPKTKWYVENNDNCKNRYGVLQQAKYFNSLLENIVVDPQGLKMDDFENIGDLETLIGEIESFLRS